MRGRCIDVMLVLGSKQPRFREAYPTPEESIWQNMFWLWKRKALRGELS